MNIKIEIPESQMRMVVNGLKDYEGEVYKKISDAVKRAGYMVHGRAVRNAPHQFGGLKRSMTVKHGNLESVVAVNVDYAGAVEFGSKPHIIRPKTKKALAFKPGAGFRFWDEAGRIIRKSVKHPGTKAQPYLRPAIKDEKRPFEQAIKKIIEDTANK